MNIVLQVDLSENWGIDLLRWADGIRVPVQSEMANRLQDITQNNFGYEGEDRPIPWQPLSPRYAVVAHGGDTTPTEILSGDLKDSIRVESSNPEFAKVFTDLDYAATQQWGGGEWDIPARPFFPLIGSEENSQLTEYTAREIQTAAEEEVYRLARK